MNQPTKLHSTPVGKYVYAIVTGTEARTYEVTGIDARPVYSVSDGMVAAVVSDCSRATIRPERAHLASHSALLKRLMLDNTILPMAFGMIADDLKAVRTLLSLNQKAFLGQLKRVAGKVEMGVRVVWDVPNIFEYFVDTHPELRAARDRLLGGNREPRQEDKIELGHLFDNILGEDREAHSQVFEEVLAPCCAEMKRSAVRNVNEVLILNGLVERPKQKQLEDAVFAAAQQFDNNYAVDFNGPWAPHNFVDMELKIRSSKRNSR